MHFHGLEFVSLARQSGDANERPGLHVGKRGGNNQNEPGFRVEVDGLILARAGVHVQTRAVGADRLDCRARGCDRRVLGEGRRDSEDERRGEGNSERRHRKSPKAA